MTDRHGDILNELSARLEGRLPACGLHLYAGTDSTNTRARVYEAEAGSTGDALFIALGQTEGRGRLGRSFVSEEGKGLYLSYLSHPDIEGGDISLLTAYAAVALCKTVEEMTGAAPRIKWVNDVYLGGRKIAGILTEGAFLEGTSRLKYAVTGVGVNLFCRDFGELSAIASDIESETGVRVSLPAFAERLALLLAGFSLSERDAVVKEYKARSFVIGERVRVTGGGEEYYARVTDINDMLHLILMTDDGQIRELSSGEISIRLDR